MENTAPEMIPETIVTIAAQKLKELKEMLAPYLKALSVEERRKLLKMSNKNFSFVAKAVEYCQHHPQFMPRYMDFDQLNSNFATIAAIRPLLASCAQLQSDLEDTAMQAGSDAFSQCLLYYNNVEGAARNGAMAAQPIMEDLTVRFFGL